MATFSDITGKAPREDYKRLEIRWESEIGLSAGSRDRPRHLFGTAAEPHLRGRALEIVSIYIEVDPEGDCDIEYLGWQWHEELIAGVQFLFPASDGNKLGVVEVWGSGCAMSAVVRGRPDAKSASLIPGWTANVNRVLEALDLPIRMGSDEAAVRGLAAS
jgi:hypothetical protein